MIRSYSDMIKSSSFIERFRYLALPGSVGASTFGFDRHINQRFYRSRQWKLVRQHVIARDEGCDLGVMNHEIHDRILIHHMNPMDISDIVDGNEAILDPEFLICASHRTHNAIHFGDERQLPKPLVERRPGDTKLW